MSDNIWNERGISWSLEPVAKRMGSNDSDKRVIGECPIAVVTDLDKFRKAYGDACVLGIMDGTSLRVICQDIGRKGIEAKASVETMKERIDARLRGIRNSPIATTKVVEVKVYALPNGKVYSGTDLGEYRREYAAALVDAGIDGTVAVTLANMQTLA